MNIKLSDEVYHDLVNQIGLMFGDAMTTPVVAGDYAKSVIRMVLAKVEASYGRGEEINTPEVARKRCEQAQHYAALIREALAGTREDAELDAGSSPSALADALAAAKLQNADLQAANNRYLERAREAERELIETKGDAEIREKSCVAAVARSERELTTACEALRKVREAISPWLGAEDARLASISAYNKTLIDQRERGIFPVHIDAEYKTMEEARKTFNGATEAMKTSARDTLAAIGAVLRELGAPNIDYAE